MRREDLVRSAQPAASSGKERVSLDRGSSRHPRAELGCNENCSYRRGKGVAIPHQFIRSQTADRYFQ